MHLLVLAIDVATCFQAPTEVRYDVIEMFSGEGQYSKAHRAVGRDACELDIKHGRHCDLDGAAGFAWGA